MKMILALCYFFFLFPAILGCDQEEKTDLKVEAGASQLFDSIPVSRLVVPMITEVSGMADSRLHQQKLWVHEDSGTPTQLMLLGNDGKVKKKVYLKGIQNRDWEEMARSGSDLFVADIGDNRQVYPSYTIYQFAEPQSAEDTIRNIKHIRFRYPDGSHDAEAFLVDPQSKDIYIITKRDNPSRIYKLAAPYSYEELNTLVYEGELPLTGVVGAALAENGNEILLKTYTNVFYHARKAQQTLLEALLEKGTPLAYQLEPQGEAITFSSSGTGFYTLSEKGFGTSVNLNFYKRR